MTNLQQEAERLYPNDSMDMTDTMLAETSRAAHIACAEKYTAILEQKDQEIVKLRTTLQEIAAWQLPETGRFWDSENKEPMSYGACHGSNGERDYIISKALKALE